MGETGLNEVHALLVFRKDFPKAIFGMHVLASSGILCELLVVVEPVGLGLEQLPLGYLCEFDVTLACFKITGALPDTLEEVWPQVGGRFYHYLPIN